LSLITSARQAAARNFQLPKCGVEVGTVFTPRVPAVRLGVGSWQLGIDDVD
jgi:hypothetical protein